MSQYFVKRGDKVQGPATVQQLEGLRSKLKPTDQLATTKDGPWKDWSQMEAILFSVVAATDIGDFDSEPLASPLVQQNTDWQPQTPKQQTQA